jgi:hypothetical protein
MGDVIHIEEWLERKVNSRAQKFRKCVGTCVEKEMGDELRVLGHRLAAYKQFSMRKAKNGNTKKTKESTIREAEA